LTLVVARGLFYIFIIHLYSIEIVGVFSLLSAIAFLFSTISSLGLQQDVQHFISYDLGGGDDQVTGQKVHCSGLPFGLSGIHSSLVSFTASALLSFHSHTYLDYLRLMDVELFSMAINNTLFYILLGLLSFRLKGFSIYSTMHWDTT